jgi:hypothetical protein
LKRPFWVAYLRRNIVYGSPGRAIELSRHK